MDIEDNQKSLQFLDLNITNNKGTYEYKIYQKKAITNVKVKPHSGHDPKTLKGIFTGFLYGAYTACKGQHQKMKSSSLSLVLPKTVTKVNN